MKRYTFTAACLAAAVFATAAAAQEIDANGDGLYSLEEMLAVFPAMTEETFTTADLSGDGLLDAEELAAAQADGLIPMQDG